MSAPEKKILAYIFDYFFSLSFFRSEIFGPK